VSEPNTFLTDSRRAVLAGEYEGAENTERTHRSRIRSRGRTAIEELTEVAQSPEIDNADVFDPEAVGRLLFWILNDPHKWTDVETGGLVDAGDLPDSYAEFRNSVYVEADQQLRKFERPGGADQ